MKIWLDVLSYCIMVEERPGGGEWFVFSLSWFSTRNPPPMIFIDYKCDGASFRCEDRATFGLGRSFPDAELYFDWVGSACFPSINRFLVFSAKIANVFSLNDEGFLPPLFFISSFSNNVPISLLSCAASLLGEWIYTLTFLERGSPVGDWDFVLTL